MTLVTNFPNKITSGNVSETEIDYLDGAAGAVLAYTSAGKKIAMGTVIVPTGASGTAFASGLTTVNFVSAGVYSSVATVAGYAGVVASASGGSITLIGVSGAGTASTANGTATWIAIGA